MSIDTLAQAIFSHARLIIGWTIVTISLIWNWGTFRNFDFGYIILLVGALATYVSFLLIQAYLICHPKIWGVRLLFISLGTLIGAIGLVIAGGFCTFFIWILPLFLPWVVIKILIGSLLFYYAYQTIKQIYTYQESLVL